MRELIEEILIYVAILAAVVLIVLLTIDTHHAWSNFAEQFSQAVAKYY